ncbi:hypothetical protein [Virgibacillus proomii]|uniref:hypothetical protein n=1 Tax=Virgibacillus proomii TaxID=84407 RepID=UPI001C126AEF|nr:hypothetical protein [Virgibacillus proomii]MBU5265833.1 hypothetical protein [Virgibacillus proomii]
MNKYIYELEDDVSNEKLNEIITTIFPNNQIIYFMMSEVHSDFKKELDEFYKTDINYLINNKKKYVVGCIEKMSIKYLYEFYERGMELPFVVTDQKVDFSFKSSLSWNHDKFYDLFELNKVPHVKFGPDNETLIYIDYESDNN